MLTPATKSIGAAAIFLIFSDLYAAPPIYKQQSSLDGTATDNDTESFYHLGAAMLYSKGLSRNAEIELHAEISSYEYPGNNDIDGQEYVTASGDISGNIYSVDYFHRS